MKLEEAIKTAIEFETRVRDVYLEAKKSATDDIGKRVFKVLAVEEQGHLDYLKSRLDEWEKNGTLTLDDLTTAVPPREKIDEGLEKLKERLEKGKSEYDIELKMLRKALDVEIETGTFYKKMVEELDSDGQKLFERFLEIEQGHQDIVQAEIDSVSGLGFWFDFSEFKLEGA